jgi:hypothetical protein
MRRRIADWTRRLPERATIEGSCAWDFTPLACHARSAPAAAWVCCAAGRGFPEPFLLKENLEAQGRSPRRLAHPARTLAMKITAGTLWVGGLLMLLGQDTCQHENSTLRTIFWNRRVVLGASLSHAVGIRTASIRGARLRTPRLCRKPNEKCYAGLGHAVAKPASSWENSDGKATGWPVLGLHDDRVRTV